MRSKTASGLSVNMLGSNSWNTYFTVALKEFAAGIAMHPASATGELSASFPHSTTRTWGFTT